MKKLILCIFMVFSFVLSPNMLSAEIESENLKEALKSEGIEPLFDDYEENDKQATIYFFRGQGESKSVDFLNYLNSIYEEYGQFFKLVSYEVGSNPDNSKLMDNVIDFLNADVTTVPFIVIGDVHFVTYDSNVNENILKAIVMLYEADEQPDNIEEVLVRYYRNEDLIIAVTLFAIMAFIGLIVYASVKGKEKENQ